MIRHPSRSLASRRTVLISAALAGGVLATAVPAEAQASAADAERFVQQLGDRTLDVLGDASLGPQVKIERLIELVDEATDLEVLARLALGRPWRDLDEARRAEYVSLFRAMIRRSLAERLGTYSGERFSVSGGRPVGERDSVVTTLVGRPGEPAYRIEWRVRSSEDGRLAIVDVIAEGVSLLLTQRAEFGEIIQRDGVDGLLQMLRERAGVNGPI